MLPQIWKLIDSHTDKRSVMKAVADIWPRGSVNYRRIERAYDDSFQGHGHDRRLSGERYFRHILGVVVIILLYLRIENADLIVAAFLHDLPEDKPRKWTIKRIEKRYGKRVALLVRSVTKPSKDRYGKDIHSYCEMTFGKVVRGGFLSMCLKLADRLHNMLTLWGTPQKKRAKIEETTVYVIPMAYNIDTLWKELHLAIAEQIKSVHLDDNEVSEVGHEEAA